MDIGLWNEIKVLSLEIKFFHIKLSRKKSWEKKERQRDKLRKKG